MAQVTNWLMGLTENPENSCSLIIRAGRRASAELNGAADLGIEFVEYVDPITLAPISAGSLTSSDTSPSNGATNGGSGYQFEVVDPNGSYTYTWTAIYSGADADTVANLDNDNSDSIRKLVVTGLPSNTTHEFHIKIVGSTSWGSCVKVRVRTFPANAGEGEIRSYTLGCNGQFQDTSFYEEKDRYTWLPYARKIHSFDPHFVIVPDDASYSNESGTRNGTYVTYNVPINSTLDVAELNPLGYTNGIFCFGDPDRSSSDSVNTTNILVHNLSTTFHQPPYSLIGKHRPIVLTAGDHGFMPNNNFSHGDVNVANYESYANGTDMVSAYRGNSRLWMRTVGALMPPSFYTPPVTPEFPRGLGPTPEASYGAVKEDYYPWGFKVSTYLFDAIVMDWLTLRSPLFDDTAGSTFFGAQQYADLQAELSGYSKDYLFVLNEKQLMLGFSNNADGPRAYTPSDNVPSSNATDSIAAFYTELKSHGRCPIIVCSDSHYLQACAESNVAFELNVAPVCKRTLNGNPVPTSGQRAGDRTGGPALDDLYDHVGTATLYDSDFVVQYRDGTDNGVLDADSSQVYNYGFGGGAHITDENYSRSVMINHGGYPVGNVFEVAAGSSEFGFATNSVYEVGMSTRFLMALEAQGSLRMATVNRQDGTAQRGVWPILDQDGVEWDGMRFDQTNNHRMWFYRYDTSLGFPYSGVKIYKGSDLVNPILDLLPSDFSVTDPDFFEGNTEQGVTIPFGDTEPRRLTYLRELTITSVADASGNLRINVSNTQAEIDRYSVGDFFFLDPQFANEVASNSDGFVTCAEVGTGFVVVNAAYLTTVYTGSPLLKPGYAVEALSLPSGGAGEQAIISHKIIKH